MGREPYHPGARPASPDEKVLLRRRSLSCSDCIPPGGTRCHKVLSLREESLRSATTDDVMSSPDGHRSLPSSLIDTSHGTARPRGAVSNRVGRPRSPAVRCLTSSSSENDERSLVRVQVFHARARTQT